MSSAAELEAELRAIMEAVGYVNQAEGQDGYERLSGQELAAKWRELTEQGYAQRERILSLEVALEKLLQHVPIMEACLGGCQSFVDIHAPGCPYAKARAALEGK